MFFFKIKSHLSRIGKGDPKLPGQFLQRFYFSSFPYFWCRNPLSFKVMQFASFKMSSFELFPRVSPSDKLSGRSLSFVSGSKCTKMAARIDSMPKITNGRGRQTPD